MRLTSDAKTLYSLQSKLDSHSNISVEGENSVRSEHGMGTEAPDPKTFASWEEAFQYPIPVVRGMEKQLRRDIDSNREKLRTLVG